MLGSETSTSKIGKKQVSNKSNEDKKLIDEKAIHSNLNGKK